MSGNILNFNSKKIKLKLSDSEYYDYYLAKDESYSSINDSNIKDNCLAIHYDFNNSDVFSQNTNSIYSLSSWVGSINDGYVLDTIGLTGIDNGLITFNNSMDYDNNALLSALTTSVLVIPSGETKLCLSPVTGMTGKFTYPTELIVNNSVGNYIDFKGGFYQGYYKIDGTTYEVLPNRVNKAWVAEFWLNKSDLVSSGNTGTTLNDIYPNNKGIFFYIGTRAENKFWKEFNGLNTGTTSGCTSGSTKWCTVIKETDVDIVDDHSGELFPLNPPLITINEITNQFLIYGRAYGNSSSNRCKNKRSGMGNKTTCSFTGDSIFVTTINEENSDFRNPFLIYGRSRGKSMCSPCTTDGEKQVTTCDYSGSTKPIDELDWKSDVENNALAFIIKDDGSIGYRLLTTNTCSGKTECVVEEKFSNINLINDDEWTNISIRFVSSQNYDDCDLKTKKARKGKLMFYVNCKLKFVTPFDEFIARRLGIDSEHWKKQIGVPYNISLGGGSQGLLENMTFDGQDPNDLGLCVENNFAGTFIGSISQFKFYVCDINWLDIKKGCNEYCDRYNTCVGCKK